MSKKLIQAAAGAAGGESVYVEDVFSTYLYIGTSAAGNTVNNGIDLDGEGGMVWLKSRGDAQSHGIFDTERGAGKLLSSDTTSAELSYTDISAFNSNGFTLGYYSGWFNSSSYDQCSWTFRKQAGFFDVVTYTGDGTAGRTVSHNLGSVPGCIIVKSTSTTGNWMVYHRGTASDAETDVIRLNLTNAAVDTALTWNDTAPTSTEFTLGTSSDTNNSGTTYVAYLFAHDDQSFGDDSDESIIKCGSYTGTGSDGNSISLGFEPQWVLVKKTNEAYDWTIFDNMRGVVNGGNDGFLHPNLSDAEDSVTNAIHFDADGFTVNGGFAWTNDINDTYIYIAIRRPMKTPEAGTDVFAPIDDTGSKDHNLGFSPDLTFFKRTDSVGNWIWYDRLRGNDKYLRSNGTNAEATLSNIIDEWLQEGVSVGSNISAGDAYSLGNFKRATGFFDVVAYTGDGATSQSLNHNLKAVPELMIVKSRSASDAWNVYSSATGNTKYLVLNTNAAPNTQTNRWNDTSPTDTVFTIGNSGTINNSGTTYIAYLFATLAGVSKVGSYTGNGSSQDIDCGFSSSARFVLIKRTDAIGDWLLYDSARGIVSSGNDKLLRLNLTSTELTYDDIDPYSSGFTIKNGSTVSNISGASYIFLAIA